MTFGERLKYFRVKSNMNQQDLSVLLNVAPQTISKWENDLSEPEFQLISKITNIFKISHDDLFIDDPKVEYKGIIFTANKDLRMKNVYVFFTGFAAFLSLALLITTIYLSTLEELPWYFPGLIGLMTGVCIFFLFIISKWRNTFNEASDIVLEVYKDRIHIKDGNLILYEDKIEKFVVKRYNPLSGIRVYDDSGYIKVWTSQHKKIVVRDIESISKLREVMYQMKSNNIEEKK